MERFQFVSNLGEGAYGTVWKCLDRESGEMVAMKRFKEAHVDQDVMRLALREIRTLKSCCHQNIVRLHEAFRSKSGRVYMVLEYVPRTLTEELKTHPMGLHPDDVKLYTYQLLQAAAYMHRQNVLHRDLKPANILLSNKGELKVCDFGFARTLLSGPAAAGLVNIHGEAEYTTYVMTRWYRAPEVIVNDAYGAAVDVWAIGCLFAEMASGRPLLPGRNSFDQLWLTMRCLGRLPDRQMELAAGEAKLAGIKVPQPHEMVPLCKRCPNMSPDMMQLLEGCLELDPHNRLTAEQALQLPYFADVQQVKQAHAQQMAFVQQQQQQLAAMATACAITSPQQAQRLLEQQAHWLLLQQQRQHQDQRGRFSLEQPRQGSARPTHTLNAAASANRAYSGSPELLASCAKEAGGMHPVSVGMPRGHSSGLSRMPAGDTTTLCKAPSARATAAPAPHTASAPVAAALAAASSLGIVPPPPGMGGVSLLACRELYTSMELATLQSADDGSLLVHSFGGRHSSDCSGVPVMSAPKSFLVSQPATKEQRQAHLASHPQPHPAQPHQQQQQPQQHQQHQHSHSDGAPDSSGVGEFKLHNRTSTCSDGAAIAATQAPPACSFPLSDPQLHPAELAAAAAAAATLATSPGVVLPAVKRRTSGQQELRQSQCEALMLPPATALGRRCSSSNSCRPEDAEAMAHAPLRAHGAATSPSKLPQGHAFITSPSKLGPAQYYLLPSCQEDTSHRPLHQHQLQHHRQPQAPSNSSSMQLPTCSLSSQALQQQAWLRGALPHVSAGDNCVVGARSGSSHVSAQPEGAAAYGEPSRSAVHHALASSHSIPEHAAASADGGILSSSVSCQEDLQAEVRPGGEADCTPGWLSMDRHCSQSHRGSGSQSQGNSHGHSYSYRVSSSRGSGPRSSASGSKQGHSHVARQASTGEGDGALPRQGPQPLPSMLQPQPPQQPQLQGQPSKRKSFGRVVRNLGGKLQSLLHRHKE